MNQKAYQLLHYGYTILPIIAGVDKFFNYLVTWEKYLFPLIPQTLNISPSSCMLGVGAIEIITGIITFVKPRIGGYIVGCWLLGIVGNVLLLGGYYDIALRDFGLAIGAFALAQMKDTS